MLILKNVYSSSLSSLIMHIPLAKNVLCEEHFYIQQIGLDFFSLQAYENHTLHRQNQ